MNVLGSQAGMESAGSIGSPLADLRRRPKQPLDDFTLLDHNHSWVAIVNTIADNDFRSVPDDFREARDKMNEWTMVGFVEHF